MRNKITKALLCCLLLLPFSCRKETGCTTGLNGEWIWTASYGGLGGWTLTPESEMATQKLVIDDFFFREYLNDSLVFESEYDLGISEEPLLGTEERAYIEFGSGGIRAIIIGASELELIEQCFDCFSHQYRRK